MKLRLYIFSFLLLSVSLLSYSQSPFPSGIRLNNATEVTEADSIPIIGTNMIINRWISVDNLLNGASINQDNKNLVISPVVYNPQTQSNVANAVNALATFTVDEHQNLYIIAIPFGRPSPTQTLHYIYILKDLGKDNYGTGGTAISSTDLQLISTITASSGTIETLPNTQFVELGDVGSTDITTAFNAHTFTGAENPIQDQDDGYVIVNVVINGQELQYLFVGEGGNYGTGGSETAVDDDLILLTDLSELQDTQFIDLGEIGTDEIQDAFNAHTFTGAENPVQDQTSGYVVVNTLVNGNPVDYLFVGSGGSYGTGGSETAVQNDFIVYLPFEEQEPDNSWNIATGSVGIDTGIQATQVTGPIVHNGTVFVNRLMVNGGSSSTQGIQNRDTNWLYINGNQGLILRSINPNDGYVRVTSTGKITELGDNEQTQTLLIGRDFDDTLISNNNLFSGIKIRDNVNMSSKTNSTYASLYLNPAVLDATGKFYGILSTYGDIEFNNANLTLGDYGSGSITGTATYNLAVDTDGNVIETALGSGGSGIENIVEDTTPQLGGNLDLNGNLITSISPIETPDTGAVISLSTIGGNNCNLGSANATTSYSIAASPVLNGYARVLINAASEPTITGATQEGGTSFQANTDMYMIVWNKGTEGVVYYFISTSINSNSLLLEYGVTGTIDGTNRIFTTTQDYQSGTIKVWLNGLLQFLTDDFTETDTNEITFAIGNEPQIGDKIVVEYLKN